jgi:hypothetical protein
MTEFFLALAGAAFAILITWAILWVEDQWRYKRTKS